jgi:DnaK suppressor protein
MPAKKVASKKRKKVTASKKRKLAPKKSAAKKKVAKKKLSKKKSPSRKPAARKKVSKKKVAAKKKVSKKKVGKKTSGRKKRPVARKKAPSKKKVSKKKIAAKKKPISKKKPAAQKTSVMRLRTATPSKPPTRSKRSGSSVLAGPIHGIKPYKGRRGEEYMGVKQLAHFKKILSAWKEELMHEVDRTVHHMQDEAANFPDPNDRATQESEFGLELRTRDRERKLLRKIDSALNRVDDGSYGFCDETGEEIGLKRLEARPVATLSLEAQERREMSERQFRDRDDRYR